MGSTLVSYYWNTECQQKLEELNKYVENFENDINSMKDICEKINNWTERGIDLVSCHEPLNLQIESWKNTMNVRFYCTYKCNTIKASSGRRTS